MPATLEPGLIYVSDEFGVAVHLCACSCGDKVVTPLSPTEWELTGGANSPALWPSIGNWQSPCRSHYIIRQGRVLWQPRWTAEEIDAGRRAEEKRDRAYYVGEAHSDGRLVARLRHWVARVLGG